MAFSRNEDPAKDSERTSSAIRYALAKAEAEIDPMIRFGRCNAIWRRTKEILKEEHGIDWLSPSDINPLTRFD